MPTRAEYDCYRNREYLCSGTLNQIADELGLSPATVKHYAYYPSGHKYQLYRWPRRERDLAEMRAYKVPECRREDGALIC